MATQAVERIIGLLPSFPANSSAATILAGVNAHERRGPKTHRVNYSLLRQLPNGPQKAGAIAIALKGIANGGQSQTGLTQQYAMIADLTLGDGGYGPFDADLDTLVTAVQAVGILTAEDVDSLRYSVPLATLEEVQQAIAIAAKRAANNAVTMWAGSLLESWAATGTDDAPALTHAGFKAVVAGASIP